MSILKIFCSPSRVRTDIDAILKVWCFTQSAIGEFNLILFSRKVTLLSSLVKSQLPTLVCYERILYYPRRIIKGPTVYALCSLLFSLFLFYLASQKDSNLPSISPPMGCAFPTKLWDTYFIFV